MPEGAAPRRAPSQNGFTLPEVLIVIVLLGILAAIAIPSWFGFIEGRNAASAANQVTADLRLAHTTARNRLTNVTVSIDSSTCYTISGGINRSRCLPDGAAFDTAVTAVEFKPDGSAGISGSGDIEIARNAASAAEYKVSINTQTSRVDVAPL